MHSNCIRISLIILIALLFLSPLGKLSAQEKTTDQMPDGKELLEAFFNNLYVQTDEKSVISLRLVNKAGMEKNRKITMYIKRYPDGTFRTLIKFIAPQEMVGTALLSIEHKDRESDQWLYLPAFKKTKRIAGANKQDSFMGTDFTFEDIEIDHANFYNLKTLKKDKIQDRDCWVVEAIPKKEHKKTGYSKRLLWIDNEIKFALKIDYYNKKGVLIKTQHPSDFIFIKGRWMANNTKIINHKKGHKTFLTTEKRKAGTGIPDKVFSTRYLERAVK